MDEAASTERGRATRERILESARVLVRRNGVAGTSLKDVEAHARVGRSQMYHYFEDRDELLRAVVRANGDALAVRAGELLADVQDVAGLRRWLDAVVGADEASGSLGCPVGSLINQLDARDDRNRAVLTEAFDRWRAPLAAALDGLRSRGRLHSTAPVADIADQVMAVIQGGLLMAQLRRDPRQLRIAVELATRYLATMQ